MPGYAQADKTSLLQGRCFPASEFETARDPLPENESGKMLERKLQQQRHEEQTMLHATVVHQ